MSARPFSEQFAGLGASAWCAEGAAGSGASPHRRLLQGASR